MHISRYRFLPLLVLYVVLIALFSKREYVDDEIRYFMYAERLVEGHYVGDVDNPDLINGPGLPIVLAPFVAVGLPVYFIRFLNAFFYYGLLVFMYRILIRYIPKNKATLYTYLAGLYPLFLLRGIFQLWPELLCGFLLMGFSYYLLKATESEPNWTKSILFSALFLGAAIMVKFIYGYVLFAGIFFTFLHWVFTRDSRSAILIRILAAGFIICIPYLMYTYSLTGRTMYWGNNGGTQLYWMTAPYEGEWGNWVSIPHVNQGVVPVHEGHKEFHAQMESLTFTEQDDLFAEKAMEQLKAHPEVYLKNWIANVCRLFFNYPYSYESHSLGTYFFLLSNLFPILLGVLSLVPAWFNWKKIPYALLVIVLFHLIYLGGSSLVSTVIRYSTTVIPFMLLWIAYVEHHFVLFHIKRSS
ncbi:MAG: hypothetical protein AAFP89_14590 [Bacteroidota bacterium]